MHLNSTYHSRFDVQLNKEKKIHGYVGVTTTPVNLEIKFLPRSQS